jgi:hypothetical protein
MKTSRETKVNVERPSEGRYMKEIMERVDTHTRGVLMRKEKNREGCATEHWTTLSGRNVNGRTERVEPLDNHQIELSMEEQRRLRHWTTLSSTTVYG